MDRQYWINFMITNYYSLLLFFLLVLLFNNGVLSSASMDDHSSEDYISAVGDPGMRRDNLRVAIESWNQCNEVGEEAPQTGSPRLADCFDIYTTSTVSKGA